MIDAPWLTAKDDKIILHLYLQPGAKRDEVVGLFDQMLKIRIASPPVEGKANKALLKFLSVKLGVKISQISIQGGEHSRMKTVQVDGIDYSHAYNRLLHID